MSEFNDMFSRVGTRALREAMTDPRRSFKQQMVAAQQLVAEALNDEPTFRRSTDAERGADARAEARTLKESGT